jgi:universal stress protein A
LSVVYSGSSAPAISLAVRLAVAEASKIYLLHVHNSNESAMSLVDAAANRFKTKLANQFLTKKEIEFEHVNLHGKPANVIVNFARKRSIDLIVMGTHGRTGLARVVIGNVAQKVMSNASCPFVTVKLPARKS